MKKFILIIIFSNLFALAGSSQQLNVIWSVSDGGSGEELVQQICSTTDSNYVAAGIFTGNLTLNGVSSTSVLNGSDIFVVKYDQNNTVIWTHTFGNACNEKISGIASDASGNIYLTGSYTSTLSIENNTIFSAGARDVFIVSLNENGNLNWIQSFGGTGIDEGKSVKVATDGSIILAASMFQTTFPLSDQVSTGGSATIAKMDSAGSVVWSICESGDAQSTIVIEDIAVNSAGTIYATGYFNGNVLSGDNGSNAMQSTGNKLWVGSYTQNGNTNFIYTPALMTGNNNGGSGITLNNNNNPAITGYTTGPIVIGANSFQSVDRDVLVFELNDFGVPVWSNVIMANGYQSANKISINNEGIIGIAGLFLEDYFAGNIQLTNAGEADAFLITINAGAVIAAASYASTGIDNLISILSQGDKFIVAGNFSGGTTANLVAGNSMLQSAGFSDFFIAGISVDQLSGNNENYNQESISSMTIFPNPASTVIKFNVSSGSSKVFVIIYSVTGAKIAEQSIEKIYSSTVTLDISMLPAGMYSIIMNDGYKNYSGKFIAE